MTAFGFAGRFYSFCRSAVYTHRFRLWIAIFFLSYYMIAVLVMRSLLLALVVVRNFENVVLMAFAYFIDAHSSVCIVFDEINYVERVP